MYSVIQTFITICTVLNIAKMLYVASLHNHVIVASGMYHIVFIKTEKYSR